MSDYETWLELAKNNERGNPKFSWKRSVDDIKKTAQMAQFTIDVTGSIIPNRSADELVKTFTECKIDMSNPKKHFWLPEDELDLLVKSFSMERIPDEKRTQGGTQDAPATDYTKLWREEGKIVSTEERKAMYDIAQDDPLWKKLRTSSIGSSSVLATIVGWSPYTGIRSLAAMHLGHFPVEGMTMDKMFPMDRGHFGEPIVARTMKIIMRCWTGQTGLHLHPKYTWKHTSPDLLVYYHPMICHNKFTANDLLAGIAEIKYLIFLIKACKQIRLAPHNMSIEYIVQQMDQLTIMEAQWNEYCSMWWENQKRPQFSRVGLS